jgi:hypothetical protein
MTDSRVHSLEVLVREMTSDRHAVDPPDREMHRWLRHKLTLIEPDLRRQDVLRLELMIERRTGCRP